MDEIGPALQAALYGRHAHIDPIKALKEITPEMARAKIEGFTRTCWDFLFHMTYWQDMVLRAYEGDEAPTKANDKDSWPDHAPSDDEWTELVGKFERDLERLSQLAEHGDLELGSKAWPQSSLLRDLMLEVCHNSFHLGQIVQLLRAHQVLQKNE